MAQAPNQPRLKDVAEHAGVSLATASMALAGHPHVRQETRLLVERISGQIGYRRRGRSSAPPTGRTGMRRVGVLIVGDTEDDQGNLPIMTNLSEVCFEQSLRLEYSFTEPGLDDAERDERAVRFADGLDGMLVVGLITPELLGRLRALDMPHLVVGHLMGDPAWPPPAPTVACDDIAMGTVATDHLLAQGHERVAFVCELTPPGLSHDRWLRGYRLAHAQRGRAPEPALIEVTGQRRSGAGPAIKRLLSLDAPPTAYVVPDARIAKDLVSRLRQRGMRLDNDALVYEGTGIEADWPELKNRPAVVVDSDQLARQAIHQLHRLAEDGSHAPVQTFIPFTAQGLPVPEQRLADTPAPLTRS